MTEEIKRFNGEFFFLSNMYPVETFIVGKYTFGSSENLYMAMKFMDSKIREEVSKKTPRESKKWCRNKAKSDRRNIRSDWHDVKLSVMDFALRHKFNIPKCRSLLLSTGDAELIEGNTWGDIFWGVDIKDKEEPGANHLGRLLMKIRSEIIKNPEIDLLLSFSIPKKRPKHGEIIVVNRRKEPEDIYVGRNSGLGNPYAVHNGDYSSTDSMRLYEDYFQKHVLNDPSSKGYPIARKIMLWIKNGYDVKLGCFCKKHTSDSSLYADDTTACHADKIKASLEAEIALNP